jgi:nucleotide-binding universal stress UspA family protein
MQLRKVAVGVDFSEESEHALEQAALIAKRFDSELVVLHVGAVAPPATRSLLPSVRVWERIVDQQAAEERVKIKAVADRLTKEGLKASHLCIDGDPAEELAKATDDLGADLLVVGTHGHTGAKLFLLGSVAQRAVRRARCDVLVCRELPQPSPPKNILVATDFSAHAERALEVAMELATSESRIDIVHCVSPISLTGHAEEGFSLADLWEQIKQEAEEQGKELLEAKKDKGMDLHFEVVEDAAAAGVLAKAKDSSTTYDLIVLGSHGRRGFRRFFLGSVAEKVVRHAPCSTLVVHRIEDREDQE